MVIFLIQSVKREKAGKAPLTKMEQLFQSGNRVVCYTDGLMRKGNIKEGALVIILKGKRKYKKIPMVSQTDVCDTELDRMYQVAVIAVR